VIDLKPMDVDKCERGRDGDPQHGVGPPGTPSAHSLEQRFFKESGSNQEESNPKAIVATGAAIRLAGMRRSTHFTAIDSRKPESTKPSYANGADHCTF
jgi:hypothetical protein